MSKQKSKRITSVRLGEPDGPQIPAPFPLPVEILLAIKHLLTPEEIRQAVERGDAARMRRSDDPLPPVCHYPDPEDGQ
jgi:hypothetical protein